MKEEGRRLISTRCANLSAPPIFLADGSGEDSSFRFLFRSFSSLFSRIILKSSCSFPPSFHFSSSRFIVRGAMRKSFKSFQSSRHFLHSNLGDEAAQMMICRNFNFRGRREEIEILIEIPNRLGKNKRKTRKRL